MKQAQATLFLMPILGVNYLLVPIRPTEGSQLEDSYDVLVAVFSAYKELLCPFYSALPIQKLLQWLGEDGTSEQLSCPIRLIGQAYQVLRRKLKKNKMY